MMVFYIFMMLIILYNLFNCCLVNVKDMLDNGTVMNGKLTETPKSCCLYSINKLLQRVYTIWCK